MMKNRAVAYFKFLISSHLLGILFFTVYRIVLLLSQKGQLANFPSGEGLLFKAFLMGFRFDLVIACYISLFPILLLLLALIFHKVGRILENIACFYIPVFSIIAFFLCASNIPYFGEFNKHINGTIFNWLGNGEFVSNMILNEPRYYFYFIVFLALTFLYLVLYIKVFKQFLFQNTSKSGSSSIKTYISYSFIGIILIGVCILGIRGRTSQKSPIRVGTAYFSNYSFPNQLGLNPVFVFIRSVLDLQIEKNKDVQLIDENYAFDLFNKEFNISDTSQFKSPIARYYSSKGTELKSNVVIILMEGMSAHFMKRFGGTEGLTPFLDSLFVSSLSFDNFFSDGIHTMNGLYATFTSYPSILSKHPMDQVEIPEYMGLSYTLKSKGYKTAFFITHDDQFDNIGGFFSSNGFERIYAQKDYPSEKVLSALGVPDDYMFEFSISKLNELQKQGQPFFAGFLTASNHGPIMVPNYFKSKFTDEKDQIIEYSDWALRTFFEKAKQQEWFYNTIFVVLADHGNYAGVNVYDMPFSYNHIPLMIYAPGFLKPFICSNLSGQVDVFPIIMGLLNMSYLNNTFGKNTLVEKRPYMFFSADDKIGCVSDSLFSIDRIQMNHSLFQYRINSTVDLAEKDSLKAAEMKNYARSMIQISQYMITHKLTLEK